MNQVEDDFEKAVSAAIPAGFEPALRLIHDRLAGMAHPWGITGSLGMILQGMPLTAGDIDLQSDRDGALEIMERLAGCPGCAVLLPAAFREGERIRSTFGRLELAGMQVEVIGDISHRLESGVWSDPPDLPACLRVVTAGGMDLPVIDLAHEARAYRLMGRRERAEQILRFLERRYGGKERR